MLNIKYLEKNLKPVTIIGLTDILSVDEGYIYDGKFIMKNLGKLNDRLFDMLMIDINSTAIIKDRVVYDIKVHKVPEDGITICPWFYIKEE